MARLSQRSSQSDSSHQKLTLDLDVRLRANNLAIPLAKIAAAIGMVVAAMWAILRFH
jgi:hypothetical protein